MMPFSVMPPVPLEPTVIVCVVAEDVPVAVTAAIVRSPVPVLEKL